MTRRRVEQESCYVLHSYPYKETSLIVEAFARRWGRVGLVARGARRPRSALMGMRPPEAAMPYIASSDGPRSGGATWPVKRLKSDAGTPA